MKGCLPVRRMRDGWRWTQASGVLASSGRTCLDETGRVSAWVDECRT